MPFGIRRSIAKSPNSIRIMWNIANSGISHRYLQHLRVYARAIGLDLKQFESDVINRSYEQKVKDDFWGGVRSRVRGTPTFFINGVRYDGPQDLNSMLEAVRTAAARAA
jgi:DSBA-like thioredoxin domain